MRGVAANGSRTLGPAATKPFTVKYSIEKADSQVGAVQKPLFSGLGVESTAADRHADRDG